MDGLVYKSGAITLELREERIFNSYLLRRTKNYYIAFDARIPATLIVL